MEDQPDADKILRNERGVVGQQLGRVRELTMTLSLSK